MKSLAKNTIFNVIYNVSNIIFPLLISIYASRILLPYGIGKVAFGQNIASYFVVFAALGIPVYGVREIARVTECNQNVNKIFTELFIINSISTLLSSFLYLALICTVSNFQNDYPLYLCCGIQIFLNFINIDWFYQGKEEYAYIACRNIVVKTVYLIATVLFVKTREDYLKYAFIATSGVCINYIFNIVHGRKYVKLEFHNIQLKKHFKATIVFVVSIFLSSVYSKVDVTMLGYLSTQTAIGLYRNAHNIIDIIISLCISITSVFLPRLSYFYLNERKKFNELIQFGIKILSFIIFPATVGLFLLAPQLLWVMYKDSFMDAVMTLRLFTILIIVKGFGNLLCYQLVIATGNEKKRLPAFFIAAVMNVVLNALLIPKFAQNGAAIASIISELIVNGYQIVVMSRIISIDVPKKNIVQGMVSALVMGIGICIVIKAASNIWMQFLGGVAMGVVTYGVINIIMKNDIMELFVRKVFRR